MMLVELIVVALEIEQLGIGNRERKLCVHSKVYHLVF